jgi:hypothetical protein
MSRIAAKQVKLTNPAPTGAGAVLYTEGAGIAASAALCFDDTSGQPRLGVGVVAAPLALLHLQADESNEGALMIEQNNAFADGPDITFRKSRGTPASPAGVNVGDSVGGIAALKYAGSSYTQVGGYRWLIASADASSFSLQTQAGGVNDTRLEITSAGALRLAQAFTMPTADGTAGQVLTTDGAGAVTWEDGGGGGVSWVYERKSADFTAVAGYHYSIDTSAGAVVVTLPASSTAAAAIRFKRRAGNNSVTINRAGTDTIDGETSYVMNNQHQANELVDSGLGAWEVF